MKLKPTVLLATFVVTMGLLLGASAAQAATVETDDDGDVIKILNLEVYDDASDSTIFYNVEFVYDTGVNVYATGFDFPIAEDALAALVAVNEALNAEDPVPPAAGPRGSIQFFIGWTERFGRVLALGGQRFPGAWGDCQEGSESECIGSTAVLDPADPFTYAKFTETQDVPPGAATLISPAGVIFENTPTYTWTAVADSRWYNLIVKDNTEEVIIDDWYTAEGADCGNAAGKCRVTPVDVLADDQHDWWIQAWNEFGEGPLSDGQSFTVDTTFEIPGPATLISPTGPITDNTPTYTWDAVAESAQYRLFVWDSAEETIIDDWYTADEADCGDGTGQCSVTPETVLADDSHEWWIRTWNEFGNGFWSAELLFTVDTTAPPGPATLISPNGAITDNTPTYTWDAVADSAEYRLFIRDSTKETIIDAWYTADEADCGDGTGQCSLTPETVLADDSHEWWIRTWNKSGRYGPWSDELSFTVDTGTVDPGVSVELDEDGNVIGIENLPVFDENTEKTTIYDVDFIYDTVTEVYGEALDFDFPAPENDENIFVALAAVNEALTAHDPTPVGAGPQGTDQFFIGYKQEDGPIVAVGGETLAGVWGPCGTDPCIGFDELQTGVAVLSPNDSFTWADFTVVE